MVTDPFAEWPAEHYENESEREERSPSPGGGCSDRSPPVTFPHPPRPAQEGSPMTAPSAPEVTVVDALIADLETARINLNSARDAFEHSPNADRQLWIETAQAHLDALLDSYSEVTS